jgi:hypothetical protein
LEQLLIDCLLPRNFETLGLVDIASYLVEDAEGTMFCSEQLEKGALGLVARGVPALPLRPRSKVPTDARWPELGPLDLAVAQHVWRHRPDLNLGALCGRDAFGGEGLTIIDIDQPDGPAVWFELAGVPVHEAATVATPSGGWHVWFRGHTDSWNPAPYLEVRSTGRQCVVPPSVNPDGSYRWVRGECPRVEDLSPLPAWAVKPEVATERMVATDTRLGLDNPVLQVPPPVYFRVLTGLVPGRDGFVCCPIHQEEMPSLKVYTAADKGWFCYGESCRRGGDVISLAAYLAGIDQPVRGSDFTHLLLYLHRRLIG